MRAADRDIAAGMDGRGGDPLTPADGARHRAGVSGPRVADQRPRSAASRWRTWRPFVLRAAVALVAGVSWELYVRARGTYATPTIPDIAAALVKLPFTETFWPAIATTLQALVIGFAVALAIGLPLGILMGRVRLLERLGTVYMTILLSVPLSATVPIIVILFGIGLRARVAVVVLFALPMLVVNVMTGVAQVDRALIDMGRSFGTTGWRLIRRVIVPAASPEIFTGIRLAAGRGIIGMIVAELIVISAGIGKLLDSYTVRFDMASVYAVVIVILLISAGFLQAIEAIERRVLSWRPALSDNH